MALVKFVTGNFASYTSGAKDNDTLYFVSDTHQIFKGSTEYGLVLSTEKPVSGAANTIYFDNTNHSISLWDGGKYVDYSLPVTDTITNDSTKVASAKAVFDYVASLDVSALEGRVDTLETEMDTVQGQIEVINGSGEGSIQKAKEDAIASAKSYTDQETAKKADIAHTHTLENITDAGALAAKDQVEESDLESTLASKINNKADKATTLAGYGIEDAYTKGGTDSAIAAAVAAAPHLKRSIVTELPDVGSADANTIYMVGTGAGSEDSNYKEYMVINGQFELIGDSKVDLTDYATKAYADQAKSDAISAAAADATSKANTAEQNAKDYADGKIEALDKADSAVADNYVSAVSQENGVISVTRAELPVKSVTEGATNGTIAVNGVDVNVHGLGTAAYKADTAFDAAGSAAAAQSAAESHADELIAALDKEDNAVEGQYVSAVSETDGVITVTRAALPQAPVIATGSTNGTISVGGQDVAVKGLGSAAYTSADDYDDAGAAESALTSAKEYADSLAGNYATAAQGSKADEVYAALTWGTL